jgi:hypothetical protein
MPAARTSRWVESLRAGCGWKSRPIRRVVSNITLDRAHGVLASESVFSQKDGQRPFVGPKHQANFLVSDDGERLLLPNRQRHTAGRVMFACADRRPR